MRKVDVENILPLAPPLHNEGANALTSKILEAPLDSTYMIACSSRTIKLAARTFEWGIDPLGAFTRWGSGLHAMASNTC